MKIQKTTRHKKIKRLRRATIKITRGGKKIASGTTAIVFSPPLKCPGYNKFNSLDYVTKLTSEKNALGDQKVGDKLKNIPDADKYAIYPLLICKLESTSQSAENQTYISKLSGLAKGYNTNIIMKNGGEIVHNIIEEISEAGSYMRNEYKKYNKHYCAVFFDAICNLGNFIISMNINGLYHNDIKDDNVVYNENDQIARLIDFGNSSNKQLVLKSGYIYDDICDYMNKIIYPSFIAILRLFKGSSNIKLRVKNGPKCYDDATKYDDFKNDILTIKQHINQLLQIKNISINTISVNNSIHKLTNINTIKQNISRIQNELDNVKDKFNKLSIK